MRRSFVAKLAPTTMAVTLVVSACSGDGATPSSTSVSQPDSASALPSATTGTATSTPTVQAPVTTSPISSTPASFAYVPLWPFASVAAARQWQREALPGGHQPWHLDAGQVALAFARQYLGFPEIDHVVRKTGSVSDAHVTVGWSADGNTGSAAVIHLVRIGSGVSRPWEVVGTDDKADFTLTKPRYGSTVAGTISVGGRIAGVDESIRVKARQLSGIVGGYCCLPAGAPASWSVRLPLTHPRTGPVTIVASTGGHVAAVERFTVTGVRSP